MDISLIIVTFNTRALLQRALLSVQQSDDHLTKEVIVVDNGSTDGSMEMVAQDFPTTIYLQQSENLGFSRANNLGANQARGTYVCLLNSDARLKPPALGKAVAFMEEHPECGVVGAQLLNSDGTRQNSIANFPSLLTELANKSLLRKLFRRKFKGKEFHSDGPFEVESIVGAFLFTRRALWEELGGLDERFFFFFEETDYCRRVKALGKTVMHIPTVEVWHDQGQTAKTVKVPARIEYWRSRYCYFQLHYGGVEQLLLGIGLILKLVLGLLINLILTPLGARFRNKCLLQAKLLAWHFKGCPSECGLSKVSADKTR